MLIQVLVLHVIVGTIRIVLILVQHVLVDIGVLMEIKQHVQQVLGQQVEQVQRHQVHVHQLSLRVSGVIMGHVQVAEQVV